MMSGMTSALTGVTDKAVKLVHHQSYDVIERHQHREGENGIHEATKRVKLSPPLDCEVHWLAPGPEIKALLMFFDGIHDQLAGMCRDMLAFAEDSDANRLILNRVLGPLMPMLASNPVIKHKIFDGDIGVLDVFFKQFERAVNAVRDIYTVDAILSFRKDHPTVPDMVEYRLAQKYLDSLRQAKFFFSDPNLHNVFADIGRLCNIKLTSIPSVETLDHLVLDIDAILGSRPVPSYITSPDYHRRLKVLFPPPRRVNLDDYNIPGTFPEYEGHLPTPRVDVRHASPSPQRRRAIPGAPPSPQSPVQAQLEPILVTESLMSRIKKPSFASTRRLNQRIHRGAESRPIVNIKSQYIRLFIPKNPINLSVEDLSSLRSILRIRRAGKSKPQPSTMQPSRTVRFTDDTLSPPPRNEIKLLQSVEEDESPSPSPQHVQHYDTPPHPRFHHQPLQQLAQAPILRLPKPQALVSGPLFQDVERKMEVHILDEQNLPPPLGKLQSPLKPVTSHPPALPYQAEQRLVQIFERPQERRRALEEPKLPRAKPSPQGDETSHAISASREAMSAASALEPIRSELLAVMAVAEDIPQAHVQATSQASQQGASKHQRLQAPLDRNPGEVSSQDYSAFSLGRMFKHLFTFSRSEAIPACDTPPSPSESATLQRGEDIQTPHLSLQASLPDVESKKITASQSEEPSSPQASSLPESNHGRQEVYQPTVLAPELMRQLFPPSTMPIRSKRGRSLSRGPHLRVGHTSKQTRPISAPEGLSKIAPLQPVASTWAVNPHIEESELEKEASIRDLTKEELPEWDKAYYRRRYRIETEEDVEAARRRFEEVLGLPNLKDAPALSDSTKIEIEQQIRQEAEKAAEERRQAAQAARKAAEERAKKELEARLAKSGGLRIPKEPFVSPLNEEWDRRAQSTLHAAATTTLSVTGEGIDLRRHDFAKLVQETEWLNDEVVNGALNFLDTSINHAAGIKDVKRVTRKCLAMSSFFYKRLEEQGVERTQRVLRRYGVEKKNFLDIDTILLPICKNSHWTLLVVRPSKKTVAHMDSLNPRGSAHVAGIALNWLKNFLEEKFVQNEWKIVRHEAPQQTNGWDCGVHTITNAMCISLGLSALDCYTADDMPLQRLRIACVLLNRGFKDEFDLAVY